MTYLLNPDYSGRLPVTGDKIISAMEIDGVGPKKFINLVKQ